MNKSPEQKFEEVIISYCKIITELVNERNKLCEKIWKWDGKKGGAIKIQITNFYYDQWEFLSNILPCARDIRNNEFSQLKVLGKSFRELNFAVFNFMANRMIDYFDVFCETNDYRDIKGNFILKVGLEELEYLWKLVIEVYDLILIKILEKSLPKDLILEASKFL